MGIELKEIIGYDGMYFISNTGEIRNKFGKILKPRYKNGYIQYALSKNSKYKHINAHVLVAKMFINNPENKPCVNHIDGNKLNNELKNLEWVTRSENSIHSYRLGLQKAKYKLSIEAMKTIVSLYKNTKTSSRKLAKKFGVSQPTIFNIIRKEETHWV